MALIDEQIQDAIRKGQFADLPGAGKPLKLEDDSHTPEHLRMAHKILRDNDLAPDWIAEGRELDAARDRLTADIQKAARAGHGTTLAGLRDAVKKYNSQVLSYNLKVPRGVVHKRHLDFDGELAKHR
jgi:hypothetical protein